MAIRVILVEPESSGNVGAIARSMKNFDLNDLRIVRPKAAINLEARTYSMHGYDVLSSARIVDNLDDALKGLDIVVATSSISATSTSNLTRVSITPEQLAQRIAASKGKVGLVFGRESTGLSNQEIEKCDLLVTIPASSKYNVLNVSSAASIIFYEIFLRGNLTTATQLQASAQARERLLSQFKKSIKRADIQPHKRRLALRAFRNIISRSFITRREASLLIGALRRATSKAT